MRVTLLYDGLLTTGKAERSTRCKWDIRDQLHPQLQDLWQTNPILRDRHFGYVRPSPEGVSKPERALQVFAENYPPRTQDGSVYLPLIRGDLQITCSLDILFLRQGGPGSVIQDGDLDGRLKTLFDGLRRPQNTVETAGHTHSGLYYTLLDDDSLITGVAVRSAPLLARKDHPDGHVVLVIEAILHLSVVTYSNMDLGGT